MALSILERLPIELIHEVGNHLPPDSILALKLTNRALNNTLPAIPDIQARFRLKKKKISDCALFALQRLCLRSNDKSSDLRCILCKKYYPTDMFISSNSPACMPLSFVAGTSRPEVLELPQYYCAWHVSRLVRKIPTSPGGRNEWVSDMRRVCMHGGCIPGWKNCSCKCDSCGYRTVRTYTRYLNNDKDCQTFKFWRDTSAGENPDPREKPKGLLYVKETSLNLDATNEPVVLNLPVRYEDVESKDLC